MNQRRINLHMLAVLFLLSYINGNSMASNELMKTEGSDNRTERRISVSVTVPDMAWRLYIDEIVIVKDEIWVISFLERAPVMAGQMITTATDAVVVNSPDFPIKVFVLGKKWGWKNSENYVFLTNKAEITGQLLGGNRIFKRDVADEMQKN
jgi:hypothetical protein